jgi:diacylglycerol diphosphate phosphatase / phosphatidate phosphatase
MHGVQLPSYTIQTHGATLARKHTYDWVVLILLAAIVVVLHYTPAFSRFVGRDMITDIRYPVKPTTISMGCSCMFLNLCNSVT